MGSGEKGARCASRVAVSREPAGPPPPLLHLNDSRLAWGQEFWLAGTCLQPAKPFLRRQRDRLQIGIIVNQLATPGLGSWAAGHRLAGAGQLILACTGFALFLVHFTLMMRALWLSAMRGMEPEYPPTALWQRALLIFGVAWVWSGITSIQMYAELRREERRTVQHPGGDDLPASEAPPRLR